MGYAVQTRLTGEECEVDERPPVEMHTGVSTFVPAACAKTSWAYQLACLGRRVVAASGDDDSGENGG